MKKCPYCAEDIQDAAVFCKHCRRDLHLMKRQPSTRVCPFCKSHIESEQVMCPVCGEDASTTSASSELERNVTHSETKQAGFRLGVNAVIGAGFAFLAIVVLFTSSGQPQSPPPNPLPAEPVTARQPARDESLQTIGHQLAELDAGGVVSDDDARAFRFALLTQQLSTKYGETATRVGDMTVAGQKTLREEGVRESLGNIMDGMNELFNPQAASRQYAETLARYVALRSVRGGNRSHLDAVAALLRSNGAR